MNVRVDIFDQLVCTLCFMSDTWNSSRLTLTPRWHTYLCFWFDVDDAAHNVTKFFVQIVSFVSNEQVKDDLQTNYSIICAICVTLTEPCNLDRFTWTILLTCTFFWFRHDDIKLLILIMLPPGCQLNVCCSCQPSLNHFPLFSWGFDPKKQICWLRFLHLIHLQLKRKYNR